MEPRRKFTGEVDGDKVNSSSSLLKNSKTRIPHRLKSVRDLNFMGLPTAQLKLCPFKTSRERVF